MRPACLFVLCVRTAAAAAVAGVPAAIASPQPSTEAAETTAAEASAVTLTLATTTAEAATDPSAGRLSGDAETSPANAIPTASTGPENFNLKQQRQIPESALEAPISAKSRETRLPSRPRTIWRNVVKAITAAAAVLLVLMYLRKQNSQERRSKEKESEQYSQPKRKSEQEQEMLRGEQQVFLQQQLQGRLQETQGQQSAQEDQHVKHLQLKGHEHFQQQAHPQLLQPQQLGSKQRQDAWFEAHPLQPQQALQQQRWQPELPQLQPQPLAPQELPNMQAQVPQFQQLQEDQRQLQKPGQQLQLQQLQLQQSQEQQEHLQEQLQQRDKREHAQQLHPCFSRGQVR
ncbi:hypothetical protein, conserved [Eimeria necatrix]|uniref:Uncharacterized protein n=1 Tax=Eimeria necatrix TaxID=51315 RepID=U6MK82_9EIME|nr:hypothetical protein, conserved [Eimeria necatrix]CDJ62879.1 hypothetical protein, conserved [Eimeria necatrix]